MAAGIICEYNPFHNGHARHLAAAKDAGDGTAVCVMSGNMVQRGEAAILPKHLRAEMAVRCGADLVVELPVPWALSSAEGFARGGIGILAALGCTDTLVFGSESGNSEAAQRLGRALADPRLGELIRELTGSGMSYPAARMAAAERLAGEDAKLLGEPNDLLAAEYMAAAEMLGVSLCPVAVKREGAAHDSTAVSDGDASASAIRAGLREGKDIASLVPSVCTRLIADALREGYAPPDTDLFGTAVLSRLRILPDAAWDALPGGEEGFGRRMARAAGSAVSLEALCDEVKTRRYPMSRIRRTLLWAALGMRSGDADGTPPYIRILAANAAGRELLKKASPTLPVITKPASVRKLDERAQRVFALEAAATDLWMLACPDRSRRIGGREWTRSPVML